jgi:hypothetical protein
MVAKKSTSRTVARTRSTTGRTRADGRRPLLVYLDQEMIKELKKVALDEDRAAYEITEEAVREWLATRKMSRSRKGK